MEMIMKRCAALILLALLLVPVSGIFAETPYTGWMQMETEHLLIIFEPQDLEYARQAAVFGEEAFLKLSELLNHYPSRKIPVVLAGRTAAANGLYSPMPHAVTLFITSPPSRFLGSRTEYWMENLIVHELAHYFHLTAPVGPARILSPIFGPDAAAMNTIFMPGWWVEGIATWAESALAPGGRGDAPFFTLTFKAPVLEDSMWSLRQSGYQSAYPPQGRIYVAGYLFTSYLMERFGHDVFHRINARFAVFPFFGVSHAIRKETGYDARELYDDMVRSLQDRFSEASESVSPGTPFSPDVTGNFHIPDMTAIGPIGLIRTLDAGSAVVLYYEEGTAEVLFNLSVMDPQSFSVSACGSSAVFSSFQAPAMHGASIPLAQASWSDLHLADIATGNVTRITQGQRLFHPVLSPDGSSIAAIERTGSRYRLVLVDAASGEITVLYDPPGASVFEPRFSPDGSSIAAVEVKTGRSALFMTDGEGRITYLTDHAQAGIYRPRFTDEGHLLFGSDMNGVLSLYRLDPFESRLFLVREDPVGVFGAEPVPGGMIYGTYRSSGYTLMFAEGDLTGIPADIPAADPADDRSWESAYEHTVRPYRDYPRPGLWLPLPHVDAHGNLSPGAWGLMSSILGRHTVSGSAAWNIPHAQLTASAEYLFNPGWGSVSAQGSSRFHVPPKDDPYREHMFSLGLTVPVMRRFHAYARDQIQLSGQLQLTDYPYAYAAFTAQAAYAYARNSAPAEFFGSHRFSVRGGSHIIYPVPSGGLGTEPFTQASAQVSLPGRLPAVRLDLGVTASSFRDVSAFLPPRGNPSWAPLQDASVKAQGSLMLRFPLGLFDQPVPFGGFTGAGFTAFIQSALYGKDASIFWQEELYGGLELTAELSLSGLASVRPSVGITADLMTGKLHPYIDLDITTWIGSRPAIDQFTLRR